jgi:hypothetical protein
MKPKQNEKKKTLDLSLAKLDKPEKTLKGERPAI